MGGSQPGGSVGVVVEDVLAHFGVKGMKWGVRTKGKRPAASTDHRTTVKIKKKARKEGVKALSTKQLNTAANRLSAEKKFSDLVQQTSKMTKGHNTVKNVLAIAGTLATVHTLANSSAAKAGATFVKEQLAKHV